MLFLCTTQNTKRICLNSRQTKKQTVHMAHEIFRQKKKKTYKIILSECYVYKHLLFSLSNHNSEYLPQDDGEVTNYLSSFIILKVCLSWFWWWERTECLEKQTNVNIFKLFYVTHIMRIIIF